MPRFMSASCLVQGLNWRGLAQNAIVGIFPVWVLTNSQEADRVKPLGGSKVDSAFHPPEVDRMSTRNFWELSGKK